MRVINKLLRIIREYNIRKYWRKINPHNSTVLGVITNEMFINRIRSRSIIEVGKRTYGKINAHSSGGSDEKLVIGSYCSIALNAHFMLGGEHDYRNISTFPFRVKFGETSCEAATKGVIILEDDVWVGDNTWILSGVHIGQGAIVATGSVVTRDVPAYSIVAGNPAKVIKYRFPEDIVEKLINFDWKSFEYSPQMREQLYTHVTKDNIDDLLKSLNF